MKKRFERYVAMYKKAREFKDSTGRGLSEKELENGMTIEDKLEKLYPHFGRMHTIFGHRANIAPPAEEYAGLPRDAEDAEMIISDSQVLEEEDGNWKEDDDFRDQAEEEYPNEGFHDKINNAEQTKNEREGSAIETRHKRQAKGKGGRNVDDSKGKSTSKNRRGNGSRSGESAVTRSLGRVNKANLMDLYEEGLRNKLEFQKAFIVYRYASLVEKRAVESKKRRCQLVIELRNDGMSFTEIEEFMKFVDAD
ncbi:hypothetical protein R1sor_003361 [Riccia sorocarpa]|uniref:Uncharacterized protein n=1 Tax=Riccia sorocarpa TaxID=122646 RepID=A0ABD3H7I6_9MARC